MAMSNMINYDIQARIRARLATEAGQPSAPTLSKSPEGKVVRRKSIESDSETPRPRAMPKPKPKAKGKSDPRQKAETVTMDPNNEDAESVHQKREAAPKKKGQTSAKETPQEHEGNELIEEAPPQPEGSAKKPRGPNKSCLKLPKADKTKAERVVAESEGAAQHPKQDGADSHLAVGGAGKQRSPQKAATPKSAAVPFKRPASALESRQPKRSARGSTPRETHETESGWKARALILVVSFRRPMSLLVVSFRL